MKLIGITCDDYKANKFRKWILKAGHVLEYDGESGIDNVHLFRIECTEAEFGKRKFEIGKLIQRMELDFKQSN